MKNPTFLANLTITDTATGLTHRMTREFNYSPNHLYNTDKVWQALNFSTYPIIAACVKLGITDTNDLQGVDFTDGNIGVVRVVKKGTPYNDEQRFPDEDQNIVAVVTVTLLED